MNRLKAEILSLTGEAAVIAEKGKICYANTAAQNLLGSDCLNKSVCSVFGKEVSEAQASEFLCDATAGGQRCIVRSSRIDGSRFYFFSPAAAPDAIINDALIAGVRSNLMSLELSAGAIREEAERIENEDILKALCSVTKSCCSLTRTLDNISIIRCSGEDAKSFVKEPLNLSSLFGSIIDGLSLFTPGIRICADIEENVIVKANRRLIKELFLNLISNCLIHAEGRSKISINLRTAGNMAVLSLSDDGIGIASGMLHTIFERYRHGYDISSMGSGAGLGLAAVRKIAQLHGGTLLLESRVDYGTAVRVSLSCLMSSSTGFRSIPSENIPANEFLVALAGGIDEKFYSPEYMD